MTATPPAPDLLEVGRIDRPHGVRGDLLVTLITTATERVAPGAVLHLRDGRQLHVEHSAAHQHRWRVGVQGVRDRDAAEALSGEILLAEPLDEPPGTFLHELVGATAVLPDGSEAGTVVAIQDNPASDLLVLDGGQLVPLVFVGELDDGQVPIDPPPGLLEL